MGIVSRVDLDRAIDLSTKIFHHLKSRGVSIACEPKVASILGAQPVKVEDMDVDFVLAIGGDGTILRTNMSIPKPTPILGVNLGFRAFLATVSPEKAIEAVDQALAGGYTLEEHILLACEVDGAPQPNALNEVLIGSRSRSKIIQIEVLKNGIEVFRRFADGIIVATPTGSTAYSLSAGGSVLDPEIEGFVLTPLCPIPFMPPIVVPTDSKIEVELLGPGGGVLVVDGRQTKVLRPAETVTLTKAERKASFIRLERRDFYGDFQDRVLHSKRE